MRSASSGVELSSGAVPNPMSETLRPVRPRMRVGRVVWSAAIAPLESRGPAATPPATAAVCLKKSRRETLTVLSLLNVIRTRRLIDYAHYSEILSAVKGVFDISLEAG